ncbi:unnamed protein product, partial [Tetraodon nigroviridis]
MVVPDSKDKMYHPPDDMKRNAHVPDFNSYLALYRRSLENPEGFWKEVADEFFWKSPPTGPVMQHNFDSTKGSIYIKCMEGAKTNICYNVVDRLVNERNLGDKVAFYWEGNEADHHLTITYRQLLSQVCRCANVLKQMGVRKGDRVSIYLPMIPELVYAMLACARIGAVHSVVVSRVGEDERHFAGFSSESLCERIMDAQSSVLVTADGVCRGEKLIHLKQIADEALEKCKQRASASVTKCIVVRHQALRTKSNGTSNTLQSFSFCDVEPVILREDLKEEAKGHNTPRLSGCHLWWTSSYIDVPEECEPEWLDAEDPLFILYTSGSTGKPKHHHHDVYWCTADIGWITGHSYITYGPLANGATSVLVSSSWGIPVHPHVGRFWEIIEKYKVTKFYTAPTAIRLLMNVRTGSTAERYDLSSLKVLGSVGEPINPEAWRWYHEAVGQGRCPVVDTFWQTETGGHVLTPLPAATPLKPGSATFPFFGVEPAILSEDGEELEGEAEGYLVFKRPWPGIMRSVHGNHERFENTYFKKFPGFYVTGDGCRRDKDGYYWITGRIDDMLNISGHLMSTAEVEAALTVHAAVAEAAVVSRPHKVKGECLYCFVTLKNNREFSQTLAEELRNLVRERIGPIATPDFIQNAPGLPKTRSGKIMRRVLRQVACNQKDLGDLSTLADPKVVEVLFSQRC